jgi:hypothetical protein
MLYKVVRKQRFAYLSEHQCGIIKTDLGDSIRSDALKKYSHG